MKTLNTLVLFFLLILFSNYCTKDSDNYQFINNYTGTWQFSYKTEIINSQKDSISGPYQFKGYIKPGPQDGYIKIIYNQKFDTLIKKVEKNGLILNTCGDLNYPGGCTGSFTGNNKFHYDSWWSAERGVLIKTNYYITIDGEKLSSNYILDKVPDVSTSEAQGINVTSAVLWGVVNPNFLKTSLYFDYGTSVSYGNTIPAGPASIYCYGDFFMSANITGLAPKTTYHYRARANNSEGTSYGTDMTFYASDNTETVTDIEGNNYKTIRIGSQVRMAENLRLKKTNDGSDLPVISEASIFRSMTSCLLLV